MNAKFSTISGGLSVAVWYGLWYTISADVMSTHETSPLQIIRRRSSFSLPTECTGPCFGPGMVVDRTAWALVSG